MAYFPAYHGSGPGADAFPAGTGYSIPHPGAVLVLGISYDKVPGKAQQVPGWIEEETKEQIT